MTTKTPYTYTVLRYVHDVATGEFLNVGVALHAPAQPFVNVLCRTAYKRLKDVFPELDGDGFRTSMRHVTSQFEKFHDEIRDQLPLRNHASVMEFAQSVIRTDDSSLQWSATGSGLSANPEATLEQLFERMVTRYDHRTTAPRRDDDDVWRHFSKALQQRQVLKHFTPKTISVQDDQVEFQHAWKNGAWHCLAPLSFDLASADSIRDKAHKWLGQLASVQNSPERFQTYFLVGEPSQPDLRDAFESALSILRKAPSDPAIYLEAEAKEFSEQIAERLDHHVHTIV